MNGLPDKRLRELLATSAKRRILVVGDVMLDHFIWGNVSRISPEAPVPIVELQRESSMPGGAGNVARNLTSLQATAELFSVIGTDHQGRELKELLQGCGIECTDILETPQRSTSVKTRVVAQTQQVVRIDRETKDILDDGLTRHLLDRIGLRLAQADAVIICDYGKGVVTQPLIDELRRVCRERGVWLSLDPKPVHHLSLTDLSLITPNRKEALELAGVPDENRRADPLKDETLMLAVERLLKDLRPALLLVTLGEQGMLLCQRGRSPFHIPTVAQEVFDVSGAGDTVIAAFTLAIAAGASPVEAAILSNHAAGVVVGKVGTATVTAQEILSHARGRTAIDEHF